jgi:hypothetical protein
MKRNEIAALVLIASVSLVVSFLLVKTLFGSPKSNSTKVEKVDPIAADITQPTPEIFNKDAINPTVVIQIGSPSNQQPFGH